MLEYNEITEHKFIVFQGQPYEILSSHVFRKQQRKPVNQVKMRNLITGKVAEQAFHVSEKVKEADIEKKSVKYLYSNRGESWFCYENDPSNRFTLPENITGTTLKFIKQNSLIEALIFDDEIIGIKAPIKVDLKVTEAPPAVKGNTAQGGNKVITLETGATVNAPLFIKEGDVVRINTDTGTYTDRVS